MFVWLTIEIKDDENIFFLQRSSGRASFHIRKRSAVCVRRVDGSQCAARHTTFRALLRSSSIQEPRYPPLGDYITTRLHGFSVAQTPPHSFSKIFFFCFLFFFGPKGRSLNFTYMLHTTLTFRRGQVLSL